MKLDDLGKCASELETLAGEIKLYSGRLAEATNADDADDAQHGLSDALGELDAWLIAFNKAAEKLAPGEPDPRD